jgi:membrane protein required for colicin V production
MTGFDWFIVATIVISVLLAAAQGFFFEIFSLVGLVLGFLLAAWEYQVLSPWFLPYVKSEAVAHAASFLTVFLAVVLLAGMAGRIARWALQQAGLRWFDRALGATFGLLRGGVIVTVVVMAFTTFLPESNMVARSSLGRYFLLPAQAAAWIAPSALRERFKEGWLALRKRPDEAQAAPGTPQQAPPAEGVQQPVKK